MGQYESDEGLSPGDVIDGRWRIEGLLGRGGMAVVYEAQHLSLDRRAALKVLDLHGNSSDIARMRERFEREAKLSAKVTHPNVVTIYDHGFIEGIGQPYIAMEYLEGHDLEVELQEQGSMRPDRALRLFDGALDALARAHRDGIVHKDLKPSNLFIVEPGTRSERLVLLDFGIAGVRDDPDGRLTRTHEYAGTPAYAAPEYIEHRLVTPALDVYQMALILGEALSGAAVVQASTPMSYMMAHCQGRSDVHPRLAASPLGPVLQGGLYVDHLQRYPSAAEFRDALARVDPSQVPNLAGIVGAATFDGPPPTGPGLGNQTGPSYPPPLEQRRPETVTSAGPHPGKKRSNAPLVILALLVFCAIGVVGTGALVVVFAQGSAEEGGEVTTNEASAATPLSVASPTSPTFVMPSVPGMDTLVAGHLAASMTVTPIDNSVGLFLGFWEQFDGDVESMSSAAPSDMQSLFEHSRTHLTTTTSAGGALGESAAKMIEVTKELAEVFDDLDDYYHVTKGFEGDGHAGGEALKGRLERAYAKYVPVRDAFVKALIEATRVSMDAKRKTGTPAQVAMYDLVEAAGAQTLALLEDPTSEEANNAMANLKRTYAESRKLIRTDTTLNGSLEEVASILKESDELPEELEEISDNTKLSAEGKRYKRIAARGWPVTHYFWLTRAFKF